MQLALYISRVNVLLFGDGTGTSMPNKDGYDCMLYQTSFTIHMYTSTYMEVCVCVFVCIYLCMRLCVYLRVCLCLCVRASLCHIHDMMPHINAACPTSSSIRTGVVVVWNSRVWTPVMM